MSDFLNVATARYFEPDLETECPEPEACVVAVVAVVVVDLAVVAIANEAADDVEVADGQNARSITDEFCF